MRFKLILISFIQLPTAIIESVDNTAQNIKITTKGLVSSDKIICHPFQVDTTCI